ncbi:hypothetical protein [Tuwongella immobilis]|uniref:Transmembrane protein n=1 Tax=Tuwongella immobilis TaxID=692036 RepID=A0A6C2YNS3_9BACT|nr:hypothetical protein [Tuwongella immobilis]VIP03017.1 unnamed protein product [Tuwongella immobilis]VTS03138.1 unnamed protein product [Tuwongella immobilis]
MKPSSNFQMVFDRMTLPGLRIYLYLGFAALLFLLFVLGERNALAGGLICLFLGIPGLLFRWTFAPILVLILSFYFMLAPAGVPMSRAFVEEVPSLQLTDLLITAAVLVYLIAQYRVNSLLSQAFPLERPLIHRTAIPDEPPLDAPAQRPNTSVHDSEVKSILIQGVVFTLASLVGWVFLYYPPIGARGFPSTTVRFWIAVWSIAGSMMVGHVVLSYLSWRNMRRDEASMILRDALWWETRREQERLHHWRQWYRSGRPEPLIANDVEQQSERSERK